MSFLINPFVFAAESLPVTTGLVFWLDASDPSTFSYSSGTSVSEWRDKSGNGYHFTQATSTLQPSRNGSIGTGTTAVSFDNSDDVLARTSTPSSLVGSNSRSFFLAIKPKKSAASMNWMIYGPNLDHQLWQFNTPFWISSSVHVLHTYTSGIDSGTSVSANTGIVLHGHYNSSTNVVTLGVNNNTYTYTQSLNTAGGSTSAQPIAIGAGVSGVHGYVGASFTDFGEVVAYSSALGSTDRSSVIDYLATKWGITL